MNWYVCDCVCGGEVSGCERVIVSVIGDCGYCYSVYHSCHIYLHSNIVYVYSSSLAGVPSWSRT